MALFDDRKRVQYGNRESVMVNELEFQNLNYVDGNKRGLNMYRSGSAPPTIEGSYNAINSLFQNLDLTNNGGLPEEQMRSHPAYLSYYYSHDNINPRLPPPLLSKEEWRMQQRMRGGREIPDWRNRGFDDRFDSSLFSVQPASSMQKEKSEIIDPTVVKFANRDLELVSRGGGLGGRRKSFADILQEGSNRPNALPSPIPCKATRNVCNEFLHSGNSNVQTHHVPSSSFPVAVGSSFSRSPTPNHPFEERLSPGKVNNRPGAYISNGKSSSMNNLSDLAAYLSFTGLDRPGHGLVDKRSPANVPPKANSARIKGLNEQNSYNNARAPVVTNNAPGRYSTNHNSTNGADNRLVSGSQSNGRCDKNMQLDHHNQTIDSIDVQYYRHPANSNYLLGGKYISASHGEVLESQKAHLDALISGQKQNFGLPLLQKGHRVNGYYESLAYLLSMQYQGTSMPNTFSNIRFGNSMLQSDIPSSTKGTTGMTLLEEFKNKTRHFELSDIVGHVVEFSMDQSGSRFIQQKLETATDEEKMNVFPEIALHACALMTDVFGNYVIQKFFERGMENQKQMLAGQIKTHVLQLSLQMYGCRVIQKALETINVDLKTQMVLELDGSVLKCVRDQNGNHVIQKCIECVPEDKIQIIISSFFGQVVTLSTHPYGCRVIQRVLEHCNTQDTKKRIMVEILQSIGTLAQDQYGNYVIQHIIQHGKPEERSAIINQLKGQVVHMSQQKFASNVIEKCLTFGSPEERQVLVNEVLGSADLNEPLKEMMKDPFGNYVVQKVLETCDAKTRELILSRIKLHLFDLKKCTYVKHVIARVEKLLIAAGERSLDLEGSP